MGEKTGIEWCDATFNAWRGCSRVSSGCVNCYAESQANRFPLMLGEWGPSGTRVVASERQWGDIRKWNVMAATEGVPFRVFSSSISDIHEEWSGEMLNGIGCKMWLTPSRHFMASSAVEFGGAPRATLDQQPNPDAIPLTMAHVRRRLYETIYGTPALTWLLLTKRPENVARHMEELRAAGTVGTACLPWSNIWRGTSVENQAAAAARIPHLLNVDAAVRFLSVEPLLGPLDLSYWLGIYKPAEARSEEQRDAIPWQRTIARPVRQIQWVIVGGESGPAARPMHPDWVRSIRDQCAAAGVAFFFKQWGEFAPSDVLSDLQVGQSRSFAVVSTGGERHLIRGGKFTGESPQIGDAFMYRVGKHDGGCLLDGAIHHNFPVPRL